MAGILIYKIKTENVFCAILRDGCRFVGFHEITVTSSEAKTLQ
jgi:hypothetical protein